MSPLLLRRLCRRGSFSRLVTRQGTSGRPTRNSSQVSRAIDRGRPKDRRHEPPQRRWCHTRRRPPLRRAGLSPTVELPKLRAPGNSAIWQRRLAHRPRWRRPPMRLLSAVRALLVIVVIFLSSSPLFAQSSPSVSPASVPHLIKIAGVFHPADGQPAGAVETVTLSI